MNDKLEEVKAQIPHREPFLFVDEVLEREEGRIVTQRLIRADEPHFQGHYPGSPLMPGVLLCEACFQTGAMLLSSGAGDSPAAVVSGAGDSPAAVVSGAGDSPAAVVRAPRPHPIEKRFRGRLPHWEQTGGTYFVTWRLADSLPLEERERISRAREHILSVARQSGRDLSSAERQQLEELFTVETENLLNAGSGSCWLSDDRCAETVRSTLWKFDGERYVLHAWCVMPNHVHVVFRAMPGYSLSEILHSWKSYTAKACNKILNRTGVFWLDESFDRLVRDEQEWNRFVRYTLDNPSAAGLREWKWVGAGGSPTPQTDAGGAPTPLRKPVLTRILEAKFRGMVRPGDLLRVEVVQDEKMGDAYVMSGRVDVAGKNVLRVKFIVAMVEV